MDLFSVQDLAARFGVSERTLGYWNTRELACSKKNGRGREYTFEQALAVGIVRTLRARRFFGHDLHWRVTQIVRHLAAQPELRYLIVTGSGRVDATDNPTEAVQRVCSLPEGAFLIDLAEIREKLGRQL